MPKGITQLKLRKVGDAHMPASKLGSVFFTADL